MICINFKLDPCLTDQGLSNQSINFSCIESFKLIIKKPISDNTLCQKSNMLPFEYIALVYQCT